MHIVSNADCSLQLTFDDGPGPSTPALLDVLRAASCKATFFVLGSRLVLARDVAVRMVLEGHALGNHTHSHARAGALSPQALMDEIEATDELVREIYRLSGKPVPHKIPLRLPYGLAAGDVREVVLQRLGRGHVGWTAMADDWCRPPPTPQDLAAAMRDHLAAQRAQGKNAVLCLHDSSRHGEAHPATVAAVRLLLSEPGWHVGEQLMPAPQESDAGA